MLGEPVPGSSEVTLQLEVTPTADSRSQPVAESQDADSPAPSGSGSPHNESPITTPSSSTGSGVLHPVTTSSSESVVDHEAPVASLGPAVQSADSASSPPGDETSPAKEAASALASMTTSVVARALPPGKPPYRSPDHSDDDEAVGVLTGGEEDGGSSPSAVDSQPNRSPILPGLPPSSGSTESPQAVAQLSSPATTTAPSVPGSSKQVLPARRPPAKGKSPATGAGKPSSSSKKVSLRSTKSSTATGSGSRSSSSNHKVAKTPSKAKTKAKAQAPSKVALSAAPYHIDIKTLVARAAQCARMDSRESDHMKQLRGLPFFHPGARRCWDQMLALSKC
ncbi:hypothetical protein PHYBOEH_011220 [Phytophthora boehmeriae]|uniref:Uncharacterized protein n=1 Tax=Phytophthora boehmeriae TaxID=109152 RepID=A0A8T1VIE6_9STRA|nr:hypothetical protein PHYBOEH_011220 [Phytophthora boehmeriae]